MWTVIIELALFIFTVVPVVTNDHAELLLKYTKGLLSRLRIGGPQYFSEMCSVISRSIAVLTFLVIAGPVAGCPTITVSAEVANAFFSAVHVLLL